MALPSPAEYVEALQNPSSCFADAELRQGLVTVDSTLGLPKPISGTFASVYQVKCGSKQYAVRCFLIYHPDQEQRYATISSYLKNSGLQCMVGFEFLKQGIKIRGQWYPILKMEWITGEPLNTYLKRNLTNPTAIYNLARSFQGVAESLRQKSIAHGDLQHGNILVVNGNLRLIDYDGMFVPGLAATASHETGHRNYQHPSRNERDFNPSVDNFSTWVIYLSLLGLSRDPNLWHRLGAGDEHLLFQRGDFENPHTSQALQALELTGDPTVQSIASLLRSFCYLSNLTTIPPLDGTEAPVPISLTQPPIDQHIAMNTGASWVIEHLPVSRKPIVSDFIPERLCFILMLAIGMAMVLSSVWNSVSPFIPATFISGMSLLTLVMAAFQFHRLPERRKRQGLLVDMQRVEVEANNYDEMFKKANDEIKHLTEEETRKLANQNSKQRQLSINERQDYDAIDLELKSQLANLKSQRQVLVDSEKDEIGFALKKIQDIHLTQHLSQYGVASAKISGIYGVLKDRLLASGIRTAADIVAIHFIQPTYGQYTSKFAYIETVTNGRIRVEGIGQTKGTALAAWHQRVKAHAAINMPKSLPSGHEISIKQKYQSKLSNLDSQIITANEGAATKRYVVRQKYQKEQNATANELQSSKDFFSNRRREMDKNIHTLRQTLSEKHWNVARLRQEMHAYDQISFRSYLKQALTNRT